MDGILKTVLNLDLGPHEGVHNVTRVFLHLLQDGVDILRRHRKTLGLRVRIVPVREWWIKSLVTGARYRRYFWLRLGALKRLILIF